MQKWIFLLVSLVTVNLCNSQVTFEKNYYVEGYLSYDISPAVVNTKDSGYILISCSGDTNMTNNFFITITRLNKEGKVLWNKNSDTYTVFNDYGLGEVVQYPDSSLVLLRNSQYPNEIPWRHIGFAHIDKNANAIWAKNYYCPPSRGDIYMNSFSRTYDNGLIGLGDVEAIPSGLDFKFLLKTDSSGNILWCKQYFPDTCYGIAVSSEISRISLTADSGFLISFAATDSISSNNYTCLMKTDANGNIQWAKRYDLAVLGSLTIYNGVLGGVRVNCKTKDIASVALCRANCREQDDENRKEKKLFHDVVIVSLQR